MATRPSLKVKIIYALGQLGWSLASFGAGNLMVYFYMPPETGENPIFQNFIYQGALFGFIAILGLINFGGRIFDAITDPLIANYSDSTSSSFGKRKKPMAIAAVPFALLSFLIFYPISADTTINTIWLLVIVFLFFIFMTLYCVPYNALISELGHHPDDRMSISTIISITWALGFIIGNSAYAIQGFFETSMTSLEAFQLTIGIFAIVSLVLMLIPVFFLDENKYCLQSNTASNARHSLKVVTSNKNFVYFSLSDLMYWLSLTFIQLGVSYYVTILMGMEKEYASLFLLISFFLSFTMYWPINVMTKKIGKKKILMAAFLVLSVIFTLTFLIDFLPVPSIVPFVILSALAAFPMASFGIIPNAIVADIIHQQEQQTGEQYAGMFYAARTFMMKLGISLANLIFPSLLLLGKSTENPSGIKASAICALVFCLVGFGLFIKYTDVQTKPKMI